MTDLPPGFTPVVKGRNDAPLVRIARNGITFNKAAGPMVIGKKLEAATNDRTILLYEAPNGNPVQHHNNSFTLANAALCREVMDTYGQVAYFSIKPSEYGWILDFIRVGNR